VKSSGIEQYFCFRSILRYVANDFSRYITKYTINFMLIFNQIYGILWYLILFFILIIFLKFTLKSSWFKGIFGEFIVNLNIKLFLDKKQYHLIKNITLPTEDGSTQIDHIIVSKYGIFVIETKNMKGWIFGSSNQKIWTQKIYKYSYKFQNPLHQNYKHTKTLESLLGLSEKKFFSVIVFIGKSTFKTEMPENVTYGKKYINFIKSKKQPILSLSEVQEIIKKIQTRRLTPSFKTNRKHVKHVKNIIAEKEKVQICPKCGNKMVMREVKKGQNIGKKFWGCSNFPKCRSLINIK